MLFSLICFSFTTLLSLAQNEIQPVSFIKSADIIIEGNLLAATAKYKEAIEKFSLVNENDSNYADALHALSQCYFYDKNFSKAIECCKKGIVSKSKHTMYFYMLLGQAYSATDSTEKSIDFLAKGFQLYPWNHEFCFEIGKAYEVLKNDSAALRYYKKSVTMYPRFADGHLALARLAARNNGWVQSLLSYEMFLFLDNNSSVANAAIIEMGKIATGNFPESSSNLFNRDIDRFSELEKMLQSKSSVQIKHKTDIKIPDASLLLILEVLNERLVFDASDKGFWMQQYVSLFSMLNNKKQFDPFAAHIFRSMNDEAVQKQYKSYKSKIDQMLKMTDEFITNIIRHDPFPVNSKSYNSSARYDKKGMLISLGDYDAKTKLKKGDWVYFYSTGSPKEIGSFEKDKTNGEWKYYFESGPLQKTIMFKLGIAEGPYTVFYKNGEIAESGNNVANKPEGKVNYFYATGVSKGYTHYKSGLETGDYLLNHFNGSKYREVRLSAGRYEGLYKEYDVTGQLVEEVNYTSGKMNGINKSYFDNGVLKSECNAINNLFDGEMKTYFRSAMLQKTCSMKSGKSNGSFKTYNNDGTLVEEGNYDNGEFDGLIKIYTSEGKLHAELNYSKGALKKYRYIDINGTELSTGEEKNDTLNFMSYHEKFNTKKEEGKYIDGKREGVWINYDASGNKMEEVAYSNNLKNGFSNTFFNNEKKKSIVWFTNGKENSLYTEYFQNGNHSASGKFVNGKKEGEWMSYYPNNNLKERTFYCNGEQKGCTEQFDEWGRITSKNCFDEYDLPDQFTGYDTTGFAVYIQTFNKGNGECRTFYPTKNKKSFSTYQNGKPDGEEIIYYPNGTKKEVSNYTNGLLNEKVTRYYYQNTKAGSEYIYSNGILDSTGMIFSENGKLIQLLNYKNNVLHGEWKSYYDNGKLKAEGNYTDGLRNGYFTYYALDGVNVRYRLNYFQGTIFSYSYLDRNGSFVKEILLTNESGKMISYYINGNKSAEISFANGSYDGLRTLYYFNGKLESEEMFSMDALDGVSKSFHENGKIKSEENYLLGQFNNTSKYFNKKGIITASLNYQCGNLNGMQYYYDDAGRLRKKIFYVSDIPFE